MKIETYISQLLYRYQCVTVPGFGAFLSETQSAQLNESTNSFFPPKKMISFNSQIKNNDGLLANHIAHAEKTSYGFAVSAIAFEVLNWKKILEENGIVYLKNIGEIGLNEDNNLIFSPIDQNNYLPTSFGLSPFISPLVKREIFEKKIESIEQGATESLYPEESSRSSNSYLKYAAIFVLALGITGSIGYPLYQNQIASQTLMVESAVQKKVQNKIQEATFLIQNPLPAVTLSVDTSKTAEIDEKSMMPYHIIAGAYRSEKNAKKAYNQLIKNGYEARMLGENKHGLFPVLYGSYATMGEAESAQREIRKAENPDAWILIEKL
jgi:hypothetical protein